MKRKLCPRILLVGAMLPCALAASDPGLEVRWLRPAAGQAAFGEVELVVAVRGEAVRVEFYLGERRLGLLSRPPWKLAVDLGQANVERRLSAVAVGRDGRRSAAERLLPAIRVDEELELPLTQLYLAATHDGAFVDDLDRREVRVFDEGREQTIVTFERGDVPLTATLLVDASLSMRGAPLAAALAGAREFASRMSALDEVRLLAFSDRVLAATPFTSNPDQLVAGISGAVARGGSAIHDHLLAALLDLERRQGRKVIVLLSDGLDVESLLEAEQLLPIAGRLATVVYWIRPRGAEAGARHRSFWRDEESHAAGLAALERLVVGSGGRVLELARVEEAPAAFRELIAELRSVAVVGYYPIAPRHDGAYRRVRVEVDRRGIEVRTRQGYFDD